MFHAVIRFFQEGDIWLYPIAVCFALGLAVSLERFIVLTAARNLNRKVFNAMKPHLIKHDFARVMQIARTYHAAPVSKIIAAGINKLSSTQNRDVIEYAMEECIMEATPYLETRTPYVAVLANVSTLLGLLGTVMGLIEALASVANSSPAEKAAVLGASMSIAMNATALGLMSAIPLLLIHTHLTHKTTEIVDSLEMAGVKFLNLIAKDSSSAARPVGAAPASPRPAVPPQPPKS